MSTLKILVAGGGTGRSIPNFAFLLPVSVRQFLKLTDSEVHVSEYSFFVYIVRSKHCPSPHIAISQASKEGVCWSLWHYFCVQNHSMAIMRNDYHG